MNKFTIGDFNRMFSTDESCLDWLKDYLYPDGIFCEKCQKITKHHRMATRRSYSCDYCGHHVHPTAGTIYHKSTTPLRLWFYAVYLMASTRSGISAKQLQRELGVTYKTAWRMFKQVRSMLGNDSKPLSGNVEVDETYIGGKRPGKRGRGAAGKTIAMGMARRKGQVIAKVIPNVKATTLINNVVNHVSRKSTVITDDMSSYGSLRRMGYRHLVVNHSTGVYVMASHIQTR